mmetsp:Transcript_76863/g.205384  ORF Transcript_76863/g.205384 Transcript_76863/m.205384 type:complete len:204 (+) Transcript_76863:6668-7279(+)
MNLLPLSLPLVIRALTIVRAFRNACARSCSSISLESLRIWPVPALPVGFVVPSLWLLSSGMTPLRCCSVFGCCLQLRHSLFVTGGTRRCSPMSRRRYRRIPAVQALFRAYPSFAVKRSMGILVCRSSSTIASICLSLTQRYLMTWSRRCAASLLATGWASHCRALANKLCCDVCGRRRSGLPQTSCKSLCQKKTGRLAILTQS